MANIAVLILAAGLGKRMGGELPKVLTPIKGQPLISYLLKSVKDSGVCERPTIVVGKQADMVKAALGPDYQYVLQEQQLGTGHAVLVAQEALRDATDVIVLYGDHPLISSDFIKKLASAHLETGSVLTMGVVHTPDYDDWRSELRSFGKIIRDQDGKIIRIVERKDASEEEAKIMELNPGYYCFKADWLWEYLEKITTDNAQQEYYLTDLVAMAVAEGHSIKTVAVAPKEALGINTPEQLRAIEQLL